MAGEHFAEWGGSERRFRLRFGEMLDLEEQCKIGIGELYRVLARHSFSARHLREVIRLGLIGGGMPPSDAKSLVDGRFDAYPATRIAQLALEIMIATFEGIPPDETKPARDPSKPMDAGAILASFAKVGITPEDLRQTSYRDFVLMMRAMNGANVQPPSEEEFLDMLARRGLDGGA